MTSLVSQRPKLFMMSETAKRVQILAKRNDRKSQHLER